MSRLCRTILALALCAALLLPAAAGASSATLRFEADQAAWKGYLETMGLPEKDAQKLGQGLQELGERFQLVFAGGQTDAGYEGELTLMAQEQALFTLKGAFSQEGKLSVWNSLMPGYLLVTDEIKQMAEQFSQSGQSAAAVDFELDEETEARLQKWTDGIPQQTEKGYFLGDAYDGATERTVMDLTDRDLYLLWTLLREPLRQAAAGIRTEELESEELLSQLDQEILDAALANRSRYRLVYASKGGEFTGLSLTASEGERQLATVSVGQDTGTGEMSAVIGAGVNGRVYYGALSLRDMLREPAFTLMLCEDRERAGYRSAAAEEENQLFRLTGRFGEIFFSEEEEGETYTFEFSAPGVEPLRESGRIVSMAERFRWTDSLYRLNGGEKLLTVSLATEENGEAVEWPEGLQELDMAELANQMENQEFLTMLQQNATQLGVKLFRTIPASLMVYLMQ